jgi:acetyltransferase
LQTISVEVSARAVATVLLNRPDRGNAFDQRMLEKLNVVLTVGSLVSNPIDGGFGVLTNAENYRASIEALQADPNVDIVLLQETVPREAGSARAENYIAMANDYAAGNAAKRIAFVTPISHGQTDYSRALRARAAHVSFLQEANKALRAIASVTRRDRLVRLANAATDDREPSAQQRAALDRLRARAGAGGVALNEVESKNILRAYGIATPEEALVTTAGSAVVAAERIGYPVVLKAVSDTLTHKSDLGAVALNLASAGDLTQAYERISKKLSCHVLAGMLVCRQVRGRQELVLGLHRDPEVGLVVMAGAGGVLVELIKDVAFAIPPLSREKASDMLNRTRVGHLLRGYRGGAALDRDAVIDALVGVGRLAIDAAELIDSVDINPLVALPDRTGTLALDALILLRQEP